MKKRALISVSDKTGVTEFTKGLIELGYEIISTGGTEAALKKAGLNVINISAITSFPECLDGRVKTLHPSVHAGLLALRDNADHMQQLQKLNINTIDVVAVNLYPFAATIAKEGVSRSEAIENIDIGGPTMLRSAAKNYQSVIVAVDPTDYDEILTRLKTNTDDLNYRLKLMQKVYRHTAYYDTVISDYLLKEAGLNIPDTLTLAFSKVSDLRYGENPHQKAAFYKSPFTDGCSIADARQLQGKELSYNNIGDAASAIELLREFDEPAAVAIKHANPCGVALGKDILEAYKKAYECDPVSIFGGIVALNRTLDKGTAEELVKIFLEIVIAPAITREALEVLSVKPNLRVLELDGINNPKKDSFMFKDVSGGLLYQECDNVLNDNLAVATKIKPTDIQLKELLFANKIVKHVKSNAIVLVKDFAAVGIGVGQTSRIWATSQAIEHAGERAKGAIAASDAFFPFSDCVEEMAKAGISAVIHPGGSKNDALSIDECDKNKMVMVLSGIRHFKH